MTDTTKPLIDIAIGEKVRASKLTPNGPKVGIVVNTYQVFDHNKEPLTPKYFHVRDQYGYVQIYERKDLVRVREVCTWEDLG